MEKKKKLARKRFAIKNDKGEYIGKIPNVSLVTTPAIEKNYALFNEAAPKRMNFQVSNEERMEITGIAMSPDQDILRFDRDNKEYYYCFFTKSDIRDYRDYFMQFGNTKEANFEHGSEYMDDFFVAESWIVTDPTDDKMNALGFKDIKEGDWALTYKCTNREIWEEVKNSSLAGFSVEIELDYFKEEKIKSILYNTEMTDQEKEEAIKDIVFK
jgi:hypothetical protein